MQLQLSPLHDDPAQVGTEDGVRIWRASTIDPALRASVPRGSPPLAPGWYRVRAPMAPRSGEVREPRLYLPDAAGRYSEARTVELEREGSAYVGEFFLPQPCDHVRFDPSTAHCEFACEALEISAMGKVASWLRRARAAPEKAAAAIEAMGGALPARRKERVLSGIRRDGAGIEIGPSHAPIAPKREGFNVHIIDHASREELLGKYAQHNLRLDQIEEVDFVWHGESYLELTGRPKHYDWIIASHLIEHTPDLIAFLADCDSILKDDGVLSLVIPDKRYTFDRFRPITGLARVVDAHVAGQKIHTQGATAEYFMNVVVKNHTLAWDARTAGEYGFIHDVAQALEAIANVRDRDAYLDIHNWCFVPSSFRLIVEDLHTLGYTTLREVQFHATEGFEFYITLGRHGQGPGQTRMALLRKIDAELATPEP